MIIQNRKNPPCNAHSKVKLGDKYCDPHQERQQHQRWPSSWRHHTFGTRQVSSIFFFIGRILCRLEHIFWVQKNIIPRLSMVFNISKCSVQKTPLVISLFICTIQNKCECGFEKPRSWKVSNFCCYRCPWRLFFP